MNGEILMLVSYNYLDQTKIEDTMSYLGHIEGGKVVFDTPTPLVDGTVVRVEAIGVPSQPEGGEKSFLERYREFIGIADDLPSDLADQHDHYLYGTPKK